MIKRPQIETVKADIKENWKRYTIGGVSGVVLAGITWGIMRNVVVSQPISVAIGDAAGGAIGVAGKKIVMHNVSLISSNRQGSPSWVVRCLETDKVFTSQRNAAIKMGLTQSRISEHLNGVRDHVNGYTFERLCLAG